MSDEIRSIRLDEVMTAITGGILRALDERKHVLNDDTFANIILTAGGILELERFARGGGTGPAVGGGFSQQTRVQGD